MNWLMLQLFCFQVAEVVEGEEAAVSDAMTKMVEVI